MDTVDGGVPRGRGSDCSSGSPEGVRPVTALEELRAGKAGDAFVALLTRTVRAVGISRNFPPPGGGKWTSENTLEVVAAFLTHDRTPKRLDWLFLHCGDDRALAASLQHVVRSYLRDVGRTTELGRLIVRLRRALRESDRFVSAPNDRWGLTGGPNEPPSVGLEALVAAAATVAVTFQPWSPTARRHEPFADRASIESLLAKVLDAAGGSLSPGDLARAIAPSLRVVVAPLFADVDPGDYPDTDFSTAGLDQLDDIVNRDRAVEVFGLLSDRERIALAHLHLKVRDLAPLIGLGHSQAAIVRSRAAEILQGELGDEEKGQEVAEMVLEIAKIWAADRTGLEDMTYNPA